MIALSLRFDSGILLCADTKRSVSARIHHESTMIFSKQYNSGPGYARSIFLVSEPAGWPVAAVHHCEHALELLQPAEYTIERMRGAIETSLPLIHQKKRNSRSESDPETALQVVLYSPSDRQCSLFRTNGAALKELIGYDCQGAAAWLGHYLIRDRYSAARSMDSLDLTTVFSMAVETFERVREHHADVGESTEILVIYANGRASDVQRIRDETRNQREYCMECLAALRS
jgi:hypothetical protein